MGAMVISVAAECISDARTRLGSNFEPAIRDLLEQGYTVTIEENTGARTFTDPELFSSWFGDAGLYLTRRGQQVDIAQSEIDSGEILRIGVGPV